MRAAEKLLKPLNICICRSRWLNKPSPGDSSSSSSYNIDEVWVNMNSSQHVDDWTHFIQSQYQQAYSFHTDPEVVTSVSFFAECFRNQDGVCIFYTVRLLQVASFIFCHDSLNSTSPINWLGFLIDVFVYFPVIVLLLACTWCVEKILLLYLAE